MLIQVKIFENMKRLPGEDRYKVWNERWYDINKNGKFFCYDFAYISNIDVDIFPGEVVYQIFSFTKSKSNFHALEFVNQYLNSVKFLPEEIYFDKTTNTYTIRYHQIGKGIIRNCTKEFINDINNLIVK